jgi:host factor-I protein
MEKPAQNIQDSFLNTARKDRTPITIYLLSGVKLSGRIRSFDKYCLVLESNHQEQMIFKHAISTVVVQHAGGREHERRPASHHEPAVAAGAPAAEPEESH